MQTVRLLHESVMMVGGLTGVTEMLGGAVGRGEGLPGILVMDFVGFVGFGQGGIVGAVSGLQAS